MTKQIAQTLCAAMAFLILVIGCTGPTTELTATNTPTSAAATARPASVTAEAAPPTETPTPTPIPVIFEIISDAGNPAQNTDYQQLLAARLQITATATFAAYNVGGVASLVLLAGDPRDKVTGATIQPLTRLLVAENGLIPWGSPDLVALTAAGSTKNILLAGLAGKELAISGLIPYTDGEHYAVIQKDNITVLKNYLDKDNADAPEYLLQIDSANPERLVTYINNSPIYLPVDWQEPIEIAKAGDLFINPFEKLKAEFVMVSIGTEFTQTPEYVQLPNGWQVFEFHSTITNRKTGKIFQGGFAAFGPHGEVLVANNNIDWSQVTEPGIGYAVSFKTDENGNPIADPFNDDSFTLKAIFFGDHDEPALFWHPEGGEDGNGAWVEEKQEYETAFEAVMALFEKEPTYQHHITAYASKDWEAETGYEPSVLQEKEGIEPGAFGEAIMDVLKPAAIANGGIAAILETGEIGIVEVTAENFDEFNFVSLVDVDENDSPVLLPPNVQEVTRLDLFIRMSYGVELRRAGIFFDQKTKTFFVYVKVKPGMHNSPKSDRRKANFGGNITTASALLATKPEDILYVYGHREGDAASIHREQADKMLSKMHSTFNKERTWVWQ